MEKIKLDDLCVPSARQIKEDPDKLIDYIDIASVDNENKKVTGFQTMSFGEAPSRARKAVKKGSILVSTVRPNLNAVAILEDDTPNVSVASTGFCILNCKDNVDNRFVFNFCKSKAFIEDMVSQATGASYPAVSDNIVRSALVPNYPYEEQCHISEILDRVSSAIEKRKVELAILDDLIKARFVEMFGDPVSNPLGWEKKMLKTVCVKLNDGTHFSPESFVEGEYKYVTAKNIKESGFDFTNITYVSEAVHRPIYERCNPELGDVLYIKDGVTTGIAMVNTLNEEFTLLSSVALLKQNRKIMDGYFLAAVLNNENMYSDIRSNMGGAAITRLTIAKLNMIQIIVPPLKLQQQFADFVHQVDKSKVAVQKALTETQLLFDSLMQQYFG